MNGCKLATAVAVVGTLATAPAYATVFTNKSAFDAANPGLTVITFEGIAPAGGVILPAPAFSGVSFNADAAVVSKSFSNPPSVPGNSPSDFLAENVSGMNRFGYVAVVISK